MTAPMQGTVVKFAVEEGQEVVAGDLVVVLEAMKMENPVTAHKDGTITGLAVEAGAAITQGTVLAEIISPAATPTDPVAVPMTWPAAATRASVRYRRARRSAFGSSSRRT